MRAIWQATHPGREVRVYRFANGYGGSVVHSAGAVEVAVLRFHGPGPRDAELVEGTPVMADVRRVGDAEQAREILEQIERLPERG